MIAVKTTHVASIMFRRGQSRPEPLGVSRCMKHFSLEEVGERTESRSPVGYDSRMKPTYGRAWAADKYPTGPLTCPASSSSSRRTLLSNLWPTGLSHRRSIRAD